MSLARLWRDQGKTQQARDVAFERIHGVLIFSVLATWIGKSCFGLNLLGPPKSIQVHLRILRFN